MRISITSGVSKCERDINADHKDMILYVYGMDIPMMQHMLGVLETYFTMHFSTAIKNTDVTETP